MTVTSPPAASQPDIAPVVRLLGGRLERSGPRCLRGEDGSLYVLQHAARTGRRCRFRLGGVPWADIPRQPPAARTALVLWSEPNRLAYVLPAAELADAVARHGGRPQLSELTIDTAMHHVIDLDWSVRAHRRLLPG